MENEIAGIIQIRDFCLPNSANQYAGNRFANIMSSNICRIGFKNTSVREVFVI